MQRQGRGARCGARHTGSTATAREQREELKHRDREPGRELEKGAGRRGGIKKLGSRA